MTDGPTPRATGDAIELPWWVFALCVLPVVVILAALVIPQSWPLRALAILPALALVLSVVRVAVRVISPSMQSVWISLAFGVWAIFPVAWLVALTTAGH